MQAHERVALERSAAGEQALTYHCGSGSQLLSAASSCCTSCLRDTGVPVSALLGGASFDLSHLGSLDSSSEEEPEAAHLTAAQLTALAAEARAVRTEVCVVPALHC